MRIYERCRDLDKHYCRHYDIDTQRERKYEHSATVLPGDATIKKISKTFISLYLRHHQLNITQSCYKCLYNTSLIQRHIYLCH